MDLLARQRAVAIGAAVAALSFLPSATAHAALADGFGVRPVVPKGASTPPAYFELEARPGQVLRRSVVASNGSKKPVTYRIDGVDGLTGQTSGVVYANWQDRRKEAGEWIALDDDEVTLQPGETRRLRFEIRVPERARPGDHLAGLAFEDRKTSSTKSRFAVKQVIRVVLGVQLRIKGGKPAQLDLGKMEIKPLPGTEVPSVVMRLGNRGDKLCKPKVKVTLTSASGKRSVSENPLDTILAHDKISYPLPFEGSLEAGKYTAAAEVSDCGETQSQTVEAVIKEGLDGGVPSSTTPVTTTVKAGGLPVWAGVGLGFGGAFGGMLGLMWMQKRRRTAE